MLGSLNMLGSKEKEGVSPSDRARERDSVCFVCLYVEKRERMKARWCRSLGSLNILRTPFAKTRQRK